MQISWGWKIALVYIGFVGLIVTLVFKSVHQHVDLVAPDYYAQEIAYQKVIDAGKNQSALSAPVQVYANSEHVSFEFPKEFATQQIAGSIQFYAPANAQMDKRFTLALADNKFEVARAALGNTNYQVKISWDADGKKYFQETDLNLAK